MKPLFLSLAILACATRAAVSAETNSTIPNRALNPGFESPADAPEQTVPDDWQVFSSKLQQVGITHTAKHAGQQSVRMTAQKAATGYQGIGLKLPVTGGTKYTFSAYVLNDKQDPLGGTGHGQLAIEWIDANGKEISRVYSQKWDSSLSKLRWEYVSLRKQEAPKSAVTANFGIHLSEGKDGGKGSILVDDIVIEP